MDPETVEVEGVGDPATDQMIEAPGEVLEVSWADAQLAALGLPEAMISAPLVVSVALLSVGVTEIAKRAWPHDASHPDSQAWQWGWRLVSVLLAALLGALASSLGRVTLAQGLYLGLAAGLCAPLIWRAARAALRRRGL